MIDKNLLNILVCPYCQEKMFYLANESKLKCYKEGHVFSVRDHVPYFTNLEKMEIDKD